MQLLENKAILVMEKMKQTESDVEQAAVFEMTINALKLAEKVRKIQILNTIEIIEFEGNGVDLQYVLIEDNENNQKILADELGASAEDFKDMRYDADPGEGLLDITEFAFVSLGADYYTEKTGFCVVLGGKEDNQDAESNVGNE